MTLSLYLANFDGSVWAAPAEAVGRIDGGSSQGLYQGHPAPHQPHQQVVVLFTSATAGVGVIHISNNRWWCYSQYQHQQVLVIFTSATSTGGGVIHISNIRCWWYSHQQQQLVVVLFYSCFNRGVRRRGCKRYAVITWTAVQGNCTLRLASVLRSRPEH